MAPEALLLLAAICVPLTLYWDFSWESTIGVDRFFGPPHAANYLAVAAAALAAIAMARVTTAAGVGGVALGRARAPLGAWVVLWGAGAFVAAMLFDRWWQASYGLAAGLWHPPQIGKAVAYFAVVAGAWIALVARQTSAGTALAAALAAGALLALISVVTTAQSFANRQHSSVFYELGCASYPIVLVAHGVAGRLRAPASAASAAYMSLVALVVWVLPRFAATPQAGPVYNTLDHMLAPPFPLLLIVPAFALDLLLRRPGRGRGDFAFTALECAAAFTALFVATQWFFSGFLLSPAADQPLFAGGGRQWPFFLRIDPGARTAFWDFMSPDLDLASAGSALCLAFAASATGLWLGRAMRGAR
ncbi:MAG TPA: hypothetical protein VMR86_02200 [Myxococcota bacterium]|nr:hypothetical protein [Myxococcota bacterium]